MLFFDKPGGTALIYSRKVGQRVLTFELRDGEIRDSETGSTWDWLKGTASAGEMKGEALEPLAGIVSFTRAWRQFHPKSEYWRPAK